MLPFKVQNLTVDVVGPKIRYDNFDLSADTSVLLVSEVPTDGGIIEISGLKGYKAGRVLVVCLQNTAGFYGRYWNAAFSDAGKQILVSNGGSDATYMSSGAYYSTIILKCESNYWVQQGFEFQFQTLQAAYDYAKATYSPGTDAVSYSVPGVLVPSNEFRSLTAVRDPEPLVPRIDRTAAGSFVLDSGVAIAGVDAKRTSTYMALSFRTGRSAMGPSILDGASDFEPKDGAALHHTYMMLAGVGVFRQSRSASGVSDQADGLAAVAGVHHYDLLVPHLERSLGGRFVYGVNRLRTDGPVLLDGNPTAYTGVLKLYHGESLEPVGPAAPALAVELASPGAYRASWETPIDLDLGQVVGYEVEINGVLEDVGLVNELVRAIAYGASVTVRVRAYDDDDLRGLWSVPVSFTYTTTTTTTEAPTTTTSTTAAPTTTTTTTKKPRDPGPPVPPPHPTTGLGPTLRLRWPNVADATVYDVYLNDQTALADVPANPSGTTVAHLYNLAAGAYDVVVVAKDRGGNASPDSQVLHVVVTEDMIRKHRAAGG